VLGLLWIVGGTFYHWYIRSTTREVDNDDTRTPAAHSTGLSDRRSRAPAQPTERTRAGRDGPNRRDGPTRWPGTGRRPGPHAVDAAPVRLATHAGCSPRPNRSARP